ncbi:DNA polymerase III subunit beta family protein [Phytohabitans kaempferiae]|uniref:MerR family transcriptional regulator n=1 Tax=Phytohabitans kaempferiae TaxID=1620943 RepID=A0ABV6M964_9ACTN
MTGRDDLLPIGTFAQVTGVTASALRFYDDCGLVRPAAVDPATGYRYYSAAQVEEVTLIRQLREAGLPLGDVRRVLTASEEQAQRLIADHLRAMERAVEEARGKASAAMALVRSRLGAAVSLPGQMLADGIGQVSPAARAGGPEPVLGGVLFEVDGRELRLVATDRYRLAVRSMAIGGRPRDPATAVVPADLLERARPWIGRQETVGVTVTGAGVRLAGPAGEETLAAIAGEYPRYRIVLDQLPEPSTRAVIPRRTLLSALGDDPEARVHLVIGDGVTVRPSGARRPVTIPAETAGAPLAISFQHATLRPVLAASVGPDVMLQLSRPDQPAVVRSADDGDLTTLAMPVTIDPTPGGAA